MGDFIHNHTMALYRYKAVDQEGKTRHGEVHADSKNDAATSLSHDGLLVLELQLKSVKASGGLSMQLTLFSRISELDKILFAKHIATSLKAGIGLNEGLEIVLGDMKNPALKKIIREAKAAVERGEPLSAIFAKYPQHFSPVFLGLVRSGELSGTLEDAFRNLSQQLLRDHDLKKRVQLAMIYPAILLTGSAAVIILMLTFVLPRMVAVFEDVLTELPFLTRMFIAVSNVLSAFPLVTISVFVLLIMGFILFRKSARGRILWFQLLQRAPVSSELIQKLALARFTRTFRNLLVSGVGAMDALTIAAQTVGNPQYEHSLLEIRDELKKGSTLATGFRSRGDLYPNMFSSLLLVGERTGTLEQSLDTLSEFYDEEVDRFLKTLVSLIEPILLFFMGILVALIALAVLSPIFRIVRIFQAA